MEPVQLLSMEPDVLPLSLPIDRLIPPAFGPLAAPVETALRRWMLPPDLARILDLAHGSQTGADPAPRPHGDCRQPSLRRRRRPDPDGAVRFDPEGFQNCRQLLSIRHRPHP